MKYIIKTFDVNGKIHYIENDLLVGDIETLSDNITDMEFVDKLNIKSELLFQPFMLIPKCEMDLK